MKVLLIGKGSREHAIAWKVSKSPKLTALYLWPGNAAMEDLGKSVPLDSQTGFADLARWSKEEGIELVISGPEAPLSEGLADIMESNGIPVFGPRQAGAMLEASKAFAKEVMHGAGIPTAASQVVVSEEACRSVAMAMLEKSGGCVLKASGLAAGKGVFVCQSKADVDNGLTHLYHSDMQQAASQVVVEEVLLGRECSYFSFIGSGSSRGLGFAVDFKRLQDNDLGPNTGGMGSYAPVAWLPKDAAEQVEAAVVRPLLEELARRDIPYTGCLYVGLMWHTEKGPQVVEFNVRLGDPEAQILAVYDQRDWLTLMASCAGVKGVESPSMQSSNEDAVVGVVMTSETYPYGKDAGRTGLLPRSMFRNEGEDCVTFAASVKANGDQAFQTGSGRVMTIVAKSSTFSDARRKAYEQVEKIRSLWPECHFRTDIAKKVD